MFFSCQIQRERLLYSIDIPVSLLVEEELPTQAWLTTLQVEKMSKKMTPKLFVQPIDLSKVSTLIYHLPVGPALSVEMNGEEYFFDLDMELGEICDTTDIDGVLHFFPKGNA